KKAIEILALIGDVKIVEPIIARLEDLHFQVRAEAARLLGHFRSNIAIKPLVYRLRKEQNKLVQLNILDALEEIQDQFIPFPLIETFQNQEFSREIKARILEVIARIGGPKVDHFLEELIRQDTDVELLLMALDVAKFSSERRVARAINEKLTHPSTKVRLKALEAVRYFPFDYDIEKIIACLDEEKKLQVEVIKTIGQLGINEAFNAIVAKLNSDDVEIIREVILSLGRLKDERAISILLNIGLPQVRSAVILALSRLIKHPTISSLMKRLTHKDWKIRLSVVKSIGEFRTGQAIPALIFSLRDENEKIRSMARKFLTTYSKKGIKFDYQGTLFLPNL
ncbi:MAG: HEAT repeat domain-containing protein, partial [Candidatus Helarchaeales archaeon]